MTNGFDGFVGETIFFFENLGLWLIIPSLLVTIFFGAKFARGMKDRSFDKKRRVGHYLLAFTIALVFTVFLITVRFSVDQVSEPEEVREEVTLISTSTRHT